MALLNVDKLSVHFGDESAPFRAVDRISYSVKQGEVVGIVGESGSGKSVNRPCSVFSADQHNHENANAS